MLAGVVNPFRSSEDALTSRPSLCRELTVIGPVVVAIAFPRMEFVTYTFLAVLGPAEGIGPALLFSMCVKMSFVYFRRFVISWLLLSRAWLNGMIDRSPRLLT